MESLVREEIDTDVRRKSISRELREAQGEMDEEGRLLMKGKKIMSRASRIIGLQPVEQRHITCFLEDGYDRDLNSVNNDFLEKEIKFFIDIVRTRLLILKDIL